MKSICFESYRQSKKEKLLNAKPKPKSLDPSWYTDNIYSNRSEDLDDDYVPDCLKYGMYKKLRNIRELDESYDSPDRGGAGGGGGIGHSLQRSSSCKEFKYPKSKSCCFGGYDQATTTSGASSKTPAVPKSFSFSAGTSKTMPFDVIDYEPPPPTRKDKKAMRKSMDYHCAADPHTRCCAREHCTSSKCLLEEIYNFNRRSGRDRRVLDRGPSTSRRNLIAEWEERNRRPSIRYPVCDEFCHHHQPSRRRPCFGSAPGYSDHFEDHFHCRADPYDTDLDHFIRDERERLMCQDKFLDEDEHFLNANAAYRPMRNKSMLEVKPPSRYDDDTCSDSTEMDLEDFNIDLEKYWEELEKPPSPIDLDMQQRNMNSNLKVKNVNVGCYNNGAPIDSHDREQERMMIKKNLLDGMPSPPQQNNSEFHFFEHAGSPLHRFSQKVYPETIPSYKYNNFYPEHSSGSGQHHHHHHHHPNHHQAAGGSGSGGGGAHNSALSLINNIFSIYKPNKYSPLNCQLNETKPEPCKKMNVPSTRRPLGAPHSEYMHSMKRPLIVSTEQPHFKIIPEKTGLKISPLYRFDFGDKRKHKLTSTARPLMFPH